MLGEMKRGRSQVIWRYTPNAVFRYNDENGWCVITEIAINKELKLEGVLADALTEKLLYWNALGPTGYPNPKTQPNKYIVGEPQYVYYDLWPIIFKCSDCDKMHWWNSVDNLKRTNDTLKCWTCKSKHEILKQAPFAFICECGYLQTLFIPKCDKNNQHSVGLDDKRSFQDSSWYCQVCQKRLGKDSKSGLGFRPCQCGKAMRGVTLTDPRVYYSQTIAIVDIQPNTLNIWQKNENFSNLLLGAAFRIPHYKASDIQNLSQHKSLGNKITPELEAMKEKLLNMGMPNDKIDEMIKESIKDAGVGPWKEYISDLAPCQEYVSLFDASNCRQTVEFVFVREDSSTINISLDGLIREANNNNNISISSQLVKDQEVGHSLGLKNLSIVQELPILLGGFGYTRFFPSPMGFDGKTNHVKLRPYITDEEKIPIYVAKNTTEAFMYELDPWRLAVFLEANTEIKIPDKAKNADHLIRAWIFNITKNLYEAGEAHLQLLTFEKERGCEVDLPSALVFGVLHTISHILKASAHQYVGIDQDSLAEYLFPAHAAGLLYVSNHVKFTLGGIDAVFRANLSQWLGTARDFANSCSFDPVCSDSGGACLACLYTKFGCNYFNRSLSRAFLFGGSVKGLQNKIVGFWSYDVTSEVKKLKKT